MSTRSWDIDRMRLLVQGGLAFGVLGGATFLAKEGVITSDAVVGLYSVALGAVGASAISRGNAADRERRPIERKGDEDVA